MFYLNAVLAPIASTTNNIADKITKIQFLEISLSRISHYSLSIDETDNTPFLLSCGHIREVEKYRKEGFLIIAVSRDIFFDKSGRKFLCGKKGILKIENNKILKVLIFDTMHPRYKNTADILVPTKEKAIKSGIKNFGKLEILIE